MLDAEESRRNGELRIYMILVGLCVVLVLIHQVIAAQEQINCVCSSLSYELERYEIDERLRSICNCENDGTFSTVWMTCDHDVRLFLQVHPMEGYYWGCRIRDEK